MKRCLTRIVIVFLMTSFTVSSIVGCGAGSRWRDRKLERRIEKLEDRVDVLERKDTLEKKQ